MNSTRSRVEELVHTCNDKVDAGTRVAAQCSHVLEAIVDNVGAVNKMAFDISNASDEQAQGISEVFKTFKPNQQKVVITVLEGESNQPEVCTRIGVCAIRNLPPNLPAGWPVHVSYTYEANGRLHVTARIKGSRARVETDFERENSLPDEVLDLWAGYVNEELQNKSE